MPKSDHSMTPRRDFLKSTARLAAASTLAGVAIPHVHAGEDNTIRLAIVGSGNRGSGAVADALSATGGPVKLVAMADLFEIAWRPRTRRSARSSAKRSTCRRSGNSSASTPTARPSTACGPATWPC